MDLKSGNPALSVKTFDGLGESVDPMTFGVVLRLRPHRDPIWLYLEILRLLGKRR